MAQLFANAARSTLTASITAGSTQLQINPADQALFPVATGADWFKVALEDSSGNLEFMRVQRAVGQSLLTITERATEDATKFPARAFVAGSLVELRMTAADLASSIAHPSIGAGAHAASAIAVTPVGAIASTNVQSALQELDSEKADSAATASALGGKVSLTGAETIAGVKTFTAQPVLPGNAASALEAVPKQQLDAKTTLASGAEATAGTDATKLLTPSTLRSGLNATGTAPVFAARAWGVFNGQTAGTFAPTSGGNVASVSRTDVGVYQVTFTTPMPDANFTAVASTSGAPGFNIGTCNIVSRGASTVTITSAGTTGTTQAVADAGTVFFVVMG